MHIPDTVSALAFLDFNGDGGGGDRACRLLNLLGEKHWPGESQFERENLREFVCTGAARQTDG